MVGSKVMAVRTGTLVAGDDTSASLSSYSTSTPRKTASGNSCKILREIQRSDQKLWPFPTVTLVVGTIPPHHRVVIPHQILGKRRPETPLKF